MNKKQSKPPKDLNRMAKFIVDTAITPPAAPTAKAMVAAEAGKIGGKVRADTLTPARRIEIAREGAAARWGRKDRI